MFNIEKIKAGIISEKNIDILCDTFVVYYVNEALNQLAQIVKMLRTVANF